MPNVLDLVQKTPEGDFKPKTDKGFVGLFVGESGSGKDTAVASFPKPIYVFDVDHRIAGMMNAIEWLGVEAMKQIDYDQFNITQPFEIIDKKCELLLVQAKAKQLQYKTIYFAGFSSLGQMLALQSRSIRRSKPGDPGDFLDAKFASQVTRSMMYKFVMPMQECGINIIFSAHVVPKWGKPKVKSDEGLPPNEVIGEKIVGVSDQFSEEIPGYFDNVFRFSKEDTNTKGMLYKVDFQGDLAKTSYPIKDKSIDVTGRSFYEEFSKLTEKMRFSIKLTGEKK